MPHWSNKWGSRGWVWLAFGLVVAFLLVQVAWWLSFQRNTIQQNIEYAETTWLQEAALVQQLWAATAPEKRAALLSELRQVFPHLEVEGDRVYVNPERLKAYRSEQMRYLRVLLPTKALFSCWRCFLGCTSSGAVSKASRNSNAASKTS